MNPTTNIFDKLEEFEIVDTSKRILGVFLGLFKNIRSIKNLTLKTRDSNINILLEEFLPCMSKLNEIYISHLGGINFKTIKDLVPTLTKITVPSIYFTEASNTFTNVDVCTI